MPATYTTNKALSAADRRMVDFDPGATGSAIVDLDPTGDNELFPIAVHRRFVAGLFRSVGTGSVTTFDIFAATDDDGTGAVIVVSHAIGSAPNAVGDTIWLECDVEQIREVLSTATHVGVHAGLVTGTDEAVIYFERSDPTFAHGAATTDYIA